MLVAAWSERDFCKRIVYASDVSTNRTYSKLIAIAGSQTI